MSIIKPAVISSRALFVLGMMLALIAPCTSQPFQSSGIPLAGAGRSAVAWGDYDNDHDLDVFVSGIGNDGNLLSILYRNDSGTFVDAGNDFIPVKEGSACWGDYDSDGDLDLLLCGISANGAVTKVFRNDGNAFTAVDTGLPAISNGTACWIDIDRDNDLDIFLSGSAITQIYINDNGMFTSAGQNFGSFNNSAASFGDYDNDGDLDLVVIGDSGAGAVSKVFRNDDGVFIDAGAGLTGLMSGYAEWIDYDCDGDLDVCLAGYNDALEAQFFLFLNEGKMFFQVFAGIEGFAVGQADWGDYDLDGDPDLILSGKASGCGAVAVGIYRNEGNGVFNKLQDEISPAIRSSLAWADYDNDGDLDFIISGLDLGDNPFTTIYRNMAGENIFSFNTPPTPPETFETDMLEDDVILSWSGASDEQTAIPALSYNIMLGATSGGHELVVPMAHYPDGYKLVAGNGNAGQSGTFRLSGLAPGTYYWSVQSVDQAFEGSPFSQEQTFTVTATGTKNLPGRSEVSVYPNPVQTCLNIIPDDDLNILNYNIIDITGRNVLSSCSGIVDNRIDVSDLLPGIYFINFITGSNSMSLQFIKQ